ncbi:MAG: amidohydrolase family protein [Pirellulales bacterium]
MTENCLIDAHIHVWTSDCAAYPLANGFDVCAMRPSTFTLQEFLAHASPCGVRRAVLIQMTHYGFDHSYILDIIRQYSNRFVGVALIDENATDLEEILNELRAGGIVGLRLVMLNRDANAWVDSRGMQNVLRSAAAQNMAACFLCDPKALPAINRVCRQFPELRVVIDHMARIGADGDLNVNQIARLCELATHRGLYVKVSAFYALGSKRPPYLDLLPMIRLLRDAFGAARLMWGSDCPFQVAPGHNYRQSLELLTERADFLSDDERQQFLQGTAEQVFFGRAAKQ